MDQQKTEEAKIKVHPLTVMKMEVTPFKKIPVNLVPKWLGKRYQEYEKTGVIEKNHHRQQMIFYGLLPKKQRAKQDPELRKVKKKEYDKKSWQKKSALIKEAVAKFQEDKLETEGTIQVETDEIKME